MCTHVSVCITDCVFRVCICVRASKETQRATKRDTLKSQKKTKRTRAVKGQEERRRKRVNQKKRERQMGEWEIIKMAARATYSMSSYSIVSHHTTSLYSYMPLFLSTSLKRYAAPRHAMPLCLVRKSPGAMPSDIIVVDYRHDSLATDSGSSGGSGIRGSVVHTYYMYVHHTYGTD